MKPIIEVENLVKRYRKAKENAVNDISFSVQEGEFFALLGPNGAGKTTTISILTTTLMKTSGMVRVAGYDTEAQRKQVRQHIGVIFQSPSLDLNLTAEENIRLHAGLYGLYPYRPIYRLMSGNYKKQIFELAQILRMEKEMFNPVKTFSGGMKRKLEIIRSLMHNPKVLFLDEPTSGLDPVSRRTLWSYLKNVREKEHTTIFLTTHYLQEAEETDNLCIMNKGKIVAQGMPGDIKEKLLKYYLIINAQEQNLLETELGQKRIPFQKTRKGIKIFLEHSVQAQEILKKVETPLITLDVYAPTLEEAYVDIIESNQNGV
ncbi:MAG: ABC transporter ATP-binding protein [Candidatus Wildermuthbacteria bacterium RIFCSPHIGHO2_12_FULL_45_9]|uniref:ABC transporter ATP-binding protein n=1 Tax=Candidatus Wildermuthbacteria bacterium RIFCSPHIGHO2_02_FULL_45_25 TaxID=1802450 RepID=A0A1G2QYI8_9BACT|nr:MAG: ABC transporter ATP-binding protein [Candidatus Wildermuthbacteria bacterium RIFCSPHIGHO2_02_FULL_45_25]OHA70437.1 MAG: ABC transporter ATP-binding protein [Candidatus Wildermuthbacteria bacterium RIFCSPHIGHO2_12_FULL_45_9]